MRMHCAPTRLSLALVAAAALGSAGCQDLNTLVTGEHFRAAPSGSRRIEVELDLQVRDSFYEALAGVYDRAELEGAMQDIVLSMADLGLRFYPVPSEEYGAGDERPAHRMLVDLQDLAVDVDHDTVEQEGAAPHIEYSVEAVTCVASATVERRRKGAPPLVVGVGEGSGRVRSHVDSAPGDTQSVFQLASTFDGEGELRVHRQDVLDAFEKAVVEALRGVVKAVDRELEQGADLGSDPY